MATKYTLHGSGTARFGECGLCTLGGQRLSLWLMQCVAAVSERASTCLYMVHQCANDMYLLTVRGYKVNDTSGT
jgi:hypothetical protein